jgi:hypothetical protein
VRGNVQLKLLIATIGILDFGRSFDFFKPHIPWYGNYSQSSREFFGSAIRARTVMSRILRAFDSVCIMERHSVD